MEQSSTCEAKSTSWMDVAVRDLLWMCAVDKDGASRRL